MPETSYIPLYTAEQVRELDRAAIEDRGIPAYELMCRAGQALARCVERHWPTAENIILLCGPGNNAGDGYVLARILRESGRAVLVVFLSDPNRLTGAASQAAQDYLACGGDIKAFGGNLPEQSGLLVDSLLGTGLDRAVEGRYREAIDAINRHPAPVLAADIPSGIHADTGEVLGVAVQAQRTVTFIGRKQGLYTGSATDFTGAVEFDDLGVVGEMGANAQPGSVMMDGPPLGSLRDPRRRNAHKGHFGHVLVLGGDLGMAGAARLAAEAAARSGAGLVSVATRGEHAASLNAGCPELMVHAVERPGDLAGLLSSATVVVAGPGLGRADWGRRLLEPVLETSLPLVLDADALFRLARDPLQRGNWILTPHPGEAGRLLGRSALDVQMDRFAAVRCLADRFGGVAVLKGAGSLICSGGSTVRLCNRGNPGMASGGMGDALSGLLGALLAQGLDLFDAASAGVWLHARAADLAAEQEGERGLLASDLIRRMRGLLNG